MNRGDWIRLSQSKAPELGSHCQTLLRDSHLLTASNVGQGLRAQELRNRLIRSRDSLLTIHDHHRHAGLLEGQSRLLADLRQELTVIVENQSTGVHHLELTVAPEAVLVGAVTRDAGLIVDNRLPTATEAVDQGGLADVGASDDRNDRTRQRAELRSIHDLTKALKLPRETLIETAK